MSIRTFKAGDLSVDTLLPNTEDTLKIYNSSILAVNKLTDDLKIDENLNKIFYLKTAQDGYVKNTFYKLILNESDGALKFVIAEDDVSVETLGDIMYVLEEYPRFKDKLPELGSAISVNYIFDDQEYGTRADVEANINNLAVIETPWTILGYNKTIPQYVKYRKKTNNGYDYKYVSSIDDKSVDVTIDGNLSTVFIKHGWENANKIVESEDCTGLLRPITAGCKVYERSEGGFGKTSIFTEIELTVESVDSNIAQNIKDKNNIWHTYGNNNPYDCPASITIEGDEYFFCGYTVTVQSTHLLTSKHNNTYYDTIRFDAPESQYAEAFNKYEEGKSYYKRNELAFTAMSPTVDNMIDEEDVYEWDEATNTMLCKSAYIQAYHTYTDSSITDEKAGQLITDSTLSVENNSFYSNGCNKWSQSAVRAFMNSDAGQAEYEDSVAFKKNPFDAAVTNGLASGNGLVLKLAKDNEFLKYVCPAVNRNSVFDKQYNTYNKDSRWKGSFVAYKSLGACSCSTTDNKVHRTHDTDKFFLLDYSEAGFTTEDDSYDKNAATSDFTDIYATGTGGNTTRIKYKYLANGGLDSSAYDWWLRSASGDITRDVTRVQATGAYNYGITTNSYMLSPACVLY